MASVAFVYLCAWWLDGWSYFLRSCGVMLLFAFINNARRPCAARPAALVAAGSAAKAAEKTFDACYRHGKPHPSRAELQRPGVSRATAPRVPPAPAQPKAPLWLAPGCRAARGRAGGRNHPKQRQPAAARKKRQPPKQTGPAAPRNGGTARPRAAAQLAFCA